MSESAGSGGAQSAAAGQSAGNTEGQQSQAVSGENTQTAQGGGENAAATGGESVQTSFENSATQTIKPEHTQEDGADDYVNPRDYIRNLYKDETFDDDDKVDRKLYRHIRDVEKYREDNRVANKKILTLFESHPELIGAIRDMDEGADFAEALALNLSPEQRKAFRETVLADDYVPQKETWQKKKQERESRFAEKQKWTESYAENRKISANNLKEFAAENKLDQAGMEALAKFADTNLADVYNGKVSKQFLAAMHRAMTADAEIAKAKEAAEVRGRNAALNEKAEKIPTGDGLPDLGKGGETKQAPKRTEAEAMIFDMVDSFNKKNEKFK